jgi:hypothetical protein
VGRFEILEFEGLNLELTVQVVQLVLEGEEGLADIQVQDGLAFFQDGPGPAQDPDDPGVDGEGKRDSSLRFATLRMTTPESSQNVRFRTGAVQDRTLIKVLENKKA